MSRIEPTTVLDDPADRPDVESNVAAALDGIADGYIVLDPQWRILRFNAAAETLFRKRRDEVLGRCIDEVWPGAMSAPIGQMVREVAATGAPQRREAASAIRPGRIFLTDVVPVGADGVGVVLQDVTAQREMAEALARSESRFRHLVEAIPGLTFVSDCDGFNLFTNQAFQTFTGRSAKQLLGRGWLEVLHPEDAAAAADRWNAPSPTPFELEARVRTAQGDFRWHRVTCTPFLDPAGEVLEWAGIGVDIEDFKRSQTELAASRDLLNLVVETAPDPIFAKDLEGRWLVINAATAQAIGVTGRDLVGLRDRDVLPAEIAAQVEANDARVFAGETLIVEETARDLGPASQVFQVIKTPLRNGAGDIVGLVGVARDVTDRLEGERHRDMLIGELNHRVRNTLAIVQAMAQQTLPKDRVAPEIRQAFTDRLMTLGAAHEVLTRSNWETVMLRDLAETTLGPFRRAGREGRFKLQGPEMRLEAKSAVALSMALHELATNAVKYGALSNDTGKVSIHWWLKRGEHGPEMKLLWSEAGGPPVTPPSRRGFGSRLIENGLARDLNGSVRIEFAEKGVTCEVRAPLPYAPA